MATVERSTVLLLEAEPNARASLKSRLEFLNYQVVSANDRNANQRFEQAGGIAAVIGQLGGDESLEALARQLRARQPDLPFILAAANAELDFDGPVWALEFPLKRQALKRLLDRAQRYCGLDRRHRLTGDSQMIRQVRNLIDQVADFDTSVLVTGPSGTGKELVARTIHDLSARSGCAFVPINCGAIPPELLESELFGHRKGAFTGAINDREGRFAIAEGGTLFLDEIGDMSLDMQVKLLRVLQEKAFEQVGSNRTQACDVRVIAATHRDLPAMVAAGEFREDLYYRLNVYPIEMPPLFKRASDLPMLMNELLMRQSTDGELRLRVSNDALGVLSRYAWPGNVRELGNLVERLAIVKPEGTIELDDLPSRYRDPANSLTEPDNMVAEAMQASSANLREHLGSVERGLIELAMSATDGVVAQAARLLSMRRTTLVEKLAKYQLN